MYNVVQHALLALCDLDAFHSFAKRASVHVSVRVESLKQGSSRLRVYLKKNCCQKKEKKNNSIWDRIASAPV